MTNSREIEVYLGNQRIEKKKALLCPPSHKTITHLPAFRAEELNCQSRHSNHRSHLAPTFTNKSKITGEEAGTDVALLSGEVPICQTQLFKMSLSPSKECIFFRFLKQGMWHSCVLFSPQPVMPHNSIKLMLFTILT